VLAVDGPGAGVVMGGVWVWAGRTRPECITLITATAPASTASTAAAASNGGSQPLVMRKLRGTRLG
jgi:hypothetical protein